jgi:DNA-binding CsgD family transcriptional regulator
MLGFRRQTVGQGTLCDNAAKMLRRLPGTLPMTDTENELRQKRSDPALVLFDASFKVVSYNAEAFRVVIYPKDPIDIHSPIRLIEAKLHPLWSPSRSSFGTPIRTIFQSGRRQYSARSFSLDNSRNGSVSRNGLYPMHVLLLERQDRKAVDLSRVAAQFHLTPREQETLGSLMQGMTSKEIANRMGISPHTVKAFLRLVMGKMQVSTRSGIIGKIVRVGN